MSLVRLENVLKQYRTEPLWEGLTLSIDPGERWGILGSNGSGKTTLLRVLAGREAIDGGRRLKASGIRVGYLPQAPAFDPEKTALETIFSSQDEAMALARQYEEACLRLAAGDARAPVAELAAKLEASGAWEVETRARTILTRLGLERLDTKMGELSVGLRKRVALAEALLSEPELLLLDEPTNHLDTAAIDWMEGYLRHYRGALVMVTHDRYFLDRVTDRILEVESGKVQAFTGNYADYVEKKRTQEEQEAAADERRANLLRRELQWLARGPKARTTKAKARQDRAHALIDETAGSGKPRVELNLSQAGSAARLGKKGVLLHGVGKRYGERVVLKDFSLELQGGDRIGLIGPNGCGKTTLLQLIAGSLEPDEGWVEWGPTVVLGHYAQESGALPQEARAIDYIREGAELIQIAGSPGPRGRDGSTITAAQMMDRFLFPPTMQHTPVGRLSGGEQRRLYLLRVLMGNPNLLLLDEPTNDLDLPTLLRLEAYLDEFPGILVVVSHDRYFLDRTVDRLFHFGSDGKPSEHAGSWTEYAESLDPVPPVRAPRPAPPAAVAKPRKLSFNETRELGRLEQEIEQGEARQAELEAALHQPQDAARTHALYEELEALKARLAVAVERWAELAERAE